MFDTVFWTHLINAVVYAFVGLFVFIAGFAAIDWWTPYDLWKELIEEKNMALAIVVAGFSIGLAIIIEAAIR